MKITDTVKLKELGKQINVDRLNAGISLRRAAELLSASDLLPQRFSDRKKVNQDSPLVSYNYLRKIENGQKSSVLQLELQWIAKSLGFAENRYLDILGSLTQLCSFSEELSEIICHSLPNSTLFIYHNVSPPEEIESQTTISLYLYYLIKHVGDLVIYTPKYPHSTIVVLHIFWELAKPYINEILTYRDVYKFVGSYYTKFADKHSKFPDLLELPSPDFVNFINIRIKIYVSSPYSSANSTLSKELARLTPGSYFCFKPEGNKVITGYFVSDEFAYARLSEQEAQLVYDRYPLIHKNSRTMNYPEKEFMLRPLNEPTLIEIACMCDNWNMDFRDPSPIFAQASRPKELHNFLSQAMQHKK